MKNRDNIFAAICVFLSFVLLCVGQMNQNGGVASTMVSPAHAMPLGGTTAQGLCKASNSDYDAVWYSRTFANAPVHAIQTVAASANGFTLSLYQDSHVSYSVTITSASTLSGGAAGYVVLEIAPTNSVLAADWVEISRNPNGQNNALIVGLALSQVGGGCVCGIVPAGFYARLRSVNTVGTVTTAYNSGQEVQL